ncbi:hypothetical protein ScPMuIL_013379 [Solemya velum]
MTWRYGRSRVTSKLAVSSGMSSAVSSRMSRMSIDIVQVLYYFGNVFGNVGLHLNKIVDNNIQVKLLVDTRRTNEMNLRPITDGIPVVDQGNTYIALVSRTPPRCHSPSSPRKNNEQSSKLPEIQEMLGQSVNNLVKYFYKPEKERGNLTFLLCGERGLVQCLELVFQYGFRSARLFRNKFFIWDYLEKVKSHYENLLDSDPNHPISRSIEAKHFCILLHKINNATETIGKDGKFQIFTCIGVRDHCLQKWLPLIANTVITGQMYEENSFLRDPSLLTFLVHILRTLDEFPIVLEASLTQGIEI